MDIPTPPAAVAALAAFVRDRLADVSGTIAPLLSRRDDVETVPATAVDRSVAAARQIATAIVGAAAPFAPTSYSRARLIRQMHASGLLTADEARRTEIVLDAQFDAPGIDTSESWTRLVDPGDRPDAPGASR